MGSCAEEEKSFMGEECVEQNQILEMIYQNNTNEFLILEDIKNGNLKAKNTIQTDSRSIFHDGDFSYGVIPISNTETVSQGK